MKDITERLRDAADHQPDNWIWLSDVADEIDTLRFELQFARDERDAARAELKETA